MSLSTTRPPGRNRTHRGVPLTVIIAAWAVPVMIIGQFAWLATVPVVLVLAGTFWDRRLKPLRWPAIGLAVAYAVPYVIWKTRSDPAPSLSKDIDPILAGLVVVVALVVIVVFYLTRRSGATRPTTPRGDLRP